MNIFSVLFLFLWTLECIYSEGGYLHSVLKGRKKTSRRHMFTATSHNKYPIFDLCTLGGITFKARTVYVNAKKTDIKVVLQAFKSTTRIESYEVVDYEVDPGDDGQQAKQKLKDANLCASFNVYEKQIGSDHLFVIRFYNNGEWWCDVYKGHSFHYKEMDVCEAVEGDIEALTDTEYNEVDDIIETKKRLGSNFWYPCPTHIYPESTLCVNTYTNIQTKARWYCHRTRIDLKGYQVVNYYGDFELGTYTLPNAQSLQGYIDNTKVCRLFRFAMDYNSEKGIRTQFLNRKNGLMCNLHRKNEYANPPRYAQTPGTGKCKRFRDYKRPKVFYNVE